MLPAYLLLDAGDTVLGVLVHWKGSRSLGSGTVERLNDERECMDDEDAKPVWVRTS